MERESRGGSIAAIAGLSNLLKKAYKHRKLGNQSNSRGVIRIVFLSFFEAVWEKAMAAMEVSCAVLLNYHLWFKLPMSCEEWLRSCCC